MMWNLQEWIICGAVALLAFAYWRCRQAVSMVSNFPGLRLPVSPMSPLGLLLPALPFPFITYPGFSFPWELKHKGLFAKFRCDTVSLCASDGRAMLFTADVPFISEMSSFALREVFPKPVEEYKVLSYLGSNLVICEGESWRRQRRIGAPAFSKEMFERLWLDMRNIVREMVEEERWMERTSLEYKNDKPITYGAYTMKDGELFVPHVVDLTLRMALAAIARAGFGIDFQWEAEESFTRVCQTFGYPRRPTWWLVLLRSVWTIGDVIMAPIQRYCGSLYALIANFNSTVTPTWKSFPLAPIRWPCVVLLYFIAEIWTLFGRPTDSDFNPREIKVHEALHLVAKDSTLRLALPAWVMYLPLRRMRRMRLAFSMLEMALKRLTDERKSFHLRQFLDQDRHKEDSRPDLLSNLVKAAMMDEGDSEQVGVNALATVGIQNGLTDEEIIGNAYIYFLAGHETTAHSLAWTLALLAAYPEYQDAAVKEIDGVWPPLPSKDEAFHIDTTMEDYAKLPFVLACYSETLRLFPPVQMIPKVAARDVSITVQASNVMGSFDPVPPVTSSLSPRLSNVDVTEPEKESILRTSLVVKKGTIIFADPPGVHYNPRYWKDPEVFDPNRFLRPYNKDAFIPFGFGSRACLGRKFSEVESVAMLAHLLRNYSVHLVPTSADGSIDVASARAKFSQASVRITLTPTEIPLIFKRR